MKTAIHNGRKIGLFSTLVIGIGGMVGGGIFAVQGEAIQLAKEATPLAFFMGSLLALLTAYSYIKLTLYFKDAGGTAVFIRKAFGQNSLTEAVNLLLWFAYLVSIALYADAFGDHALALFRINLDHIVLKHLLTTLAIILPALLNLASIFIISRTENIAVIIKLSILILVVVSGTLAMKDFPNLAAPLQQKPLDAFAGIAVASAFVFIAFQGFELIANAINDIDRPHSTLPRAFFGSVIFTAILYLLITLTVLSSIPIEHVADIKETVLAEAARPLLGESGYTLVSIAAMLSTLAAITVTLYGINRLGHELAREKELPGIMLATRGFKAFVIRLLLFSGTAILITNLLSLNTTAVLASGLFLLVFGTVNIAALSLANTINANRWITLFGAFSSFFALVALLLFTLEHMPHAALALIYTFIIALLIRFIRAVK